jgi:hypothetical protein
VVVGARTRAHDWCEMRGLGSGKVGENEASKAGRGSQKSVNVIMKGFRCFPIHRRCKFRRFEYQERVEVDERNLTMYNFSTGLLSTLRSSQIIDSALSDRRRKVPSWVATILRSF